MAAAKLTKEVADTILAYVKAGAYPETAAEAAGIDLEAFRGWLRSARAAQKRFAKAVRQAQAEARVLAETEVRAKKVGFWLLHGPGKETGERPGFSRQVKPLIVQDNRTVNVLNDPAGQEILRRILSALDSFPEARVAVAGALGSSLDISTNNS